MKVCCFVFGRELVKIPLPQANGNCSVRGLFMICLGVLNTFFTGIATVFGAVGTYLYAQNSNVTINWLLFVTFALTVSALYFYNSHVSAQQQLLASTRQQVQQHIEDCQWLKDLDDKVRLAKAVEDGQEQQDQLQWFTFILEQNLVHDKELNANITPFVTASNFGNPIIWNEDYEDKAGECCTWFSNIERIVEGTDECVKILTSEEDKRLLLRLQISYYSLFDVLSTFYGLKITLADLQVNENWNKLIKHLNKLDRRKSLYLKKSRREKKR